MDPILSFKEHPRYKGAEKDMVDRWIINNFVEKSMQKLAINYFEAQRQSFKMLEFDRGMTAQRH